jgi:murein L,D-transpeptidase YafK
MRQLLALALICAFLTVATMAAANVMPKIAPPKVIGIVVYKKERLMVLLDEDGQVLHDYHIHMGGDPDGGTKHEQGDQKTPEGRYYIEAKNDKSHYHLSLKISYPNIADSAAAEKRGVSAGGDIMIHGHPNQGFGWFGLAYRRDWTDGCIAVDDHDIEEIWKLVDIGTPIQINP